MKLEFFKGFWVSILISNFIKILPVEAELFHLNGQRDKMELIVALRDFAKAPIKTKLSCKSILSFITS